MKKIILGIVCLIVSFVVAYFGVRSQFFGMQFLSGIVAVFSLFLGMILIVTSFDGETL